MADNDIFGEFLSKFIFGTDGWIGFASPSVSNFRYYHISKINGIKLDGNSQYYFTPALHRKDTDVSEKSDILGTNALWVDRDVLGDLKYVLPPSMVVCSGHGYHLYYLLKEPLIDDIPQIEHLNQVLMHTVPQSDKACWNANRVLRLPYTTNIKDRNKPVPVTIHQPDNGVRYTIQDIQAISRTPIDVQKLIISGDVTDFDGHSERDWAVITHLLAAGASDELIRTIFEHCPVGDKVRAEYIKRGNNDHYFEQTLQSAKKSPAKEAAEDKVEKTKKAKIVQAEDGYYAGGQRISTFTLTPKYILTSLNPDEEDTIICDVCTPDVTTPNVVFPKRAFTSSANMDHSLSNMKWQWMGNDSNARQLLPFILSTVTDIRTIRATSEIGLHYFEGTWYFVGDDATLSNVELYSKLNAPIVWLPNKREHPHINLTPDIEPSSLDFVHTVSLGVNTPLVCWTFIGWFTSSILKTWIETQGYRMPILNIFGTKGSGKTTLLERVYMPLFGQITPKSWDAGTTPFVIRALCSSSNAVPISFNEFRYSQVKSFVRVLLLSYDTGYDARGTSAQQTISYPLRAPLIITGEDGLDDPAIRERIVLITLNPEVVKEGTEYYKTYKASWADIPKNFGGWYIQQILKLLEDGKLSAILTKASKEIFNAFPQTMPDRVRNNYTVALFGALVYCEIMGCTAPSPEIYATAISELIGKSGHGKTMCDTFTEDVINHVSRGGALPFKIKYNKEQNTLYIHLKPAHDWWVYKRIREQRGTLELMAIRTQLEESQYCEGRKVIDQTLMFGINLTKAVSVDLDIPNFLNIDTWEVTNAK